MKLPLWIRRNKYSFQSFMWDLENRIHCFRHGRPKYAYWNVDLWFMENIIPCLDSLIENGQGVNSKYFGKWDYKTNDYLPREDGRDPKDVRDEILIEMRDGFKAYKDYEDMVGYEVDNMAQWIDDSKVVQKRLEKSLKLFAENFQALWD